MRHEYEARFCDIDPEGIRRRLREQGAVCAMQRQLLCRTIFENDILRQNRSWLRLRKNSKYTTLTLKRTDGTTSNIESMLELEVRVSDLATTRDILQHLGLEAVRYQENYREEWHLDGVTYDLDEWPDLVPFLEVEGPDPETVTLAAKKIGLDFSTATFGSVDELYLNLHNRDILREPRLVFP